MIQAGDLIDNSIGVAFGLATLTSAAIGQIVSDVSGTLSSGFVEALADSLGLPRAELTTAQLMQRSVRVSGTAGAVVGVALGCVLGMTTLLFMDLEKAERMKRQRELRTLYTVLMEEGHKLIGGARAAPPHARTCCSRCRCTQWCSHACPSSGVRRRAARVLGSRSSALLALSNRQAA
jgi:hypothetical protein